MEREGPRESSGKAGLAHRLRSAAPVLPNVYPRLRFSWSWLFWEHNTRHLMTRPTSLLIMNRCPLSVGLRRLRLLLLYVQQNQATPESSCGYSRGPDLGTCWWSIPPPLNISYYPLTSFRGQLGSAGLCLGAWSTLCAATPTQALTGIYKLTHGLQYSPIHPLSSISG